MHAIEKSGERKTPGKRRGVQRPKGAILRMPQEIEKEYGISRWWLYRQVKVGRLEHYRVGSNIRFIPDQLLSQLKVL